MNIENRLEYLEQKITSLESTIEELKSGNFEQISVNKILIKQKETEYSYYDEYPNDFGIFIYDKNGSLLHKTSITEKSLVETIFFDKNNDKKIDIGLCKHGAARVAMYNIDGEDLVHIGAFNKEDNHSAFLKLHSQDQNGFIQIGTMNTENKTERGSYILINQEDESNPDENDSFVYIGTGSTNEEGNCFSEIEMGSKNDGIESQWKKKSTDKF